MSSDDHIPAARAGGNGDTLDLSDLQALDTAELLERARSAGLPRPAQPDPHELVLGLLGSHAKEARRIEGGGVLEVLPDGFGFLRSSSYSWVPGADDLYVSPSQIRRFHLQTGDAIRGELRPPKGTEKYFALLKVGHVNGGDPERRRPAIPFVDLGVRHPDERLRLETRAGPPAMRAVDLLAPLGRGQRGLLFGPARAGATTMLRNIARAVGENHVDIHTILLLIGQRPEDAAELRDELQGERCEVIASCFTEPPARHVHAAEIGIERGKRLVEEGQHVLVLLDSIPALTRAYHTECVPGNRPLPCGLEAAALQRAKRWFGFGRNVASDGSLTLLATARTDGNRIDQTIGEELAEAANLVIRLDGDLAERRVFPAIDVHRTRTRREEKLVGETELDAVRAFRRALLDLDGSQAAELLRDRLAATETNGDLLSGC